ncbi:hypothetical protein ABC502_00625 [Alkalimonas sp. NCh-2]
MIANWPGRPLSGRLHRNELCALAHPGRHSSNSKEAETTALGQSYGVSGVN